jgi:DNA-binding LacI/PurR family transcriptional regulator
LHGFLTELSLHPLVTVTHTFAESYSFEAGRREMQRLLCKPPVEAYFCGDDVLSIGALSALKDGGFKVPDDVGVLGLNDMEMAGWENIALTTIRQPIKQIISSSIELIVAMLDEPERYPEARLFPCTVVERSTLRARS